LKSLPRLASEIADTKKVTPEGEESNQATIGRSTAD
jgi:hypothetical protein